MERFTESQYVACYRHYWRQVKDYISARIHDEAEAEDLAQDVFERIWESRGQVRLDTLHNLVYTVMRNLVVDYLRSHRTWKEQPGMRLEDFGAYARNTVEEDYGYKELRATHGNIVRRMPEKRREVYLLYFYGGLSYASIAGRLSISECTVDSHLRLACRTVRARLGGLYGYKVTG